MHAFVVVFPSVDGLSVPPVLAGPVSAFPVSVVSLIIVAVTVYATVVPFVPASVLVVVAKMR